MLRYVCLRKERITHSVHALCGRTYTHADRLRASLGFAFICSARQRLALASFQATEKALINGFTQSTIIYNLR